MRLAAKDILETVLLDSQKPVTVTYLSRHAGIPISDAKRELQLFYDDHKKTMDLHPVYLISGSVLVIDEDNSKNKKYCSMHRCTELVRGENLEAKKKTYRILDTCEIYCLNVKPVKSLLLLYNIDHLDDDQFAASDVDRSWLNCPRADISRATLLRDHENDVKIFEKMAQVSNEAEHLSKTPSPKKKRRSQEEQEFANACLSTRISPKKKSGSPLRHKKAAIQKKPESSNASHKVVQKQRGGRIVLEEEKNESHELIAEANASNDHINKEKEKNSTSAFDSKFPKKNLALSQDDIFTNGASSPEEELDDDNEEVMKKEEVFSLQKKPFLKEEGTSQNAAQRKEEVVKKEYVTESFVDEDGFMVTKRVLKEVPLQPNSQCKVTSSFGKTAKDDSEISKLTSKNPLSKKGHVTQSKISAFFKK